MELLLFMNVHYCKFIGYVVIEKKVIARKTILLEKVNEFVTM